MSKIKIQNIFGSPYLVAEDGRVIIEKDGKIEKMELSEARKFLSGQGDEEQDKQFPKFSKYRSK